MTRDELDPKVDLDARIMRLVDQEMTNAAIAAHGTVMPRYCELVPQEERDRLACMDYVRRTVEGQTVKDARGRRVRKYDSVRRERITENGEVVEEQYWELAILVESQPKKKRRALVSFRTMLLGLLRRCPLLDDDLKEEALTALGSILERAERRAGHDNEAVA